MTWEDWKGIGLFLLALYGAGLSTWNLFQARARDRKKLSVKAGTALPVGAVQHSERWATIQVTNVGHRPVTIGLIAFQLDDGGRIAPAPRGRQFRELEDTPLPITLKDGETAHRYMLYHDIGAALIRNGRLRNVRITPVCDDSAGHSYRGPHWMVEDPAEYLDGD